MPIESQLFSAFPWYCKNQSVSYSSKFGHVMLKVYPSHCMLIFNIEQWYHAVRVPLGKTLCDREKPQISLSLNWGVPTIFLLVIVMTIINIYKTPPDIPPAKNRWSMLPLLPVQKTAWKTQLMAKLVQSYKQNSNKWIKYVYKSAFVREFAHLLQSCFTSGSLFRSRSWTGAESDHNFFEIFKLTTAERDSKLLSPSINITHSPEPLINTSHLPPPQSPWFPSFIHTP